MKKYVLSCLLIALSAAIGAQNKLTVKVSEIDKPQGELYIALFDSEVPFLSKHGEGKMVKITANSEEVVFEGLKEGKYAITMFQDENSNGKLDLGNYGIPTEKYGFSNNVDPAELRRPPVFEECMFEVGNDMEINICLVNAIK